jgi:hypothetical protein
MARHQHLEIQARRCGLKLLRRRGSAGYGLRRLGEPERVLATLPDGSRGFIRMSNGRNRRASWIGREEVELILANVSLRP